MSRQNIQISMLLIIMIFTFSVNNGVLDANIMEARNLTTAREMLEKGNWLKPTMNGELRFEKPPLPTWISAVTMSIFGQDNVGLLRIPATLAALLLIFFLFKLTKELSDDDNDLPFLVSGTAATSFYIFFMARDVSWDIYCHSFMIGAIWLMHRGLKKEGSKLKEFIGAGILMGLSFLSKGPVSFYVLLLPYLIARIITYGWNEFSTKRNALIIMIINALIVGLWWPVYIFLSSPDYSASIAMKESSAWLNRSTQPFYHYWSFPVQSGIWTIIAVMTLVYPYARDRVNRYGSYLFLAGWVWMAVFLLSLFPEKKERYLMPVLIPLSTLTAFYFKYLIDAFDKHFQTKSDTIILRFNGIVMSLISIVIPVAALIMLKDKDDPRTVYFIILFIVFLFMAFIFIKAAILKKPYWIWQGMVGLVMIACLLLFPVMPKITITNPEYRSYKELRYRNDLKEIPAYFNGEIPGKFIEVVWNCGREIKEWNPLLNPNTPSPPPFLFMSREQPYFILSPAILAKYQVEIIGHFDGNMGIKGGNPVLSNYITIIRDRNK